MSQVTVDETLCNACGICIQECPVLYLHANSNGIPEGQGDSSCISCGRCVALCPRKGAITHQKYEPAHFVPLRRELLPAPEQVVELLRARRSVRVFKDQPLEQALITPIIQGAQLAPSSHNTRSTGLTVVQDRLILDQMADHIGAFLARTVKLLRNPIARQIGLLVARRDIQEGLPLISEFERFAQGVEQGDDPVFHHAPALLVFHASRANSFGAMNAALAMSNAMLVSQSLGVGSLCIGTIVAACKHDRTIANLLHIPTENQIYGALALGYPRFRSMVWIERCHPQVEWL